MKKISGGNGVVIAGLSLRTITILFFCLLGAELFLVWADHVINVGRLIDQGPIRRFFNITREDALASWFAVTQTWMLGLTAGLLYLVSRGRQDARWQRVGWAILCLFFLYMAMDDGAEFHERIGSSVKVLILGDSAADGSRAIGIFPSYTWQLVFLPVFGAFGLFLLWFLNRTLTSTGDKLLVLVAIGLLVLAVIADFFEGIDNPRNPLDLYTNLADAWDVSRRSLVHYSKAVEEFFEMLSMSVLWIVLLRHLVNTAPVIEIHSGSHR